MCNLCGGGVFLLKSVFLHVKSTLISVHRLGPHGDFAKIGVFFAIFHAIFGQNGLRARIPRSGNFIKSVFLRDLGPKSGCFWLFLFYAVP